MKEEKEMNPSSNKLTEEEVEFIKARLRELGYL